MLGISFRRVGINKARSGRGTTHASSLSGAPPSPQHTNCLLSSLNPRNPVRENAWWRRKQSGEQHVVVSRWWWWWATREEKRIVELLIPVGKRWSVVKLVLGWGFRSSGWGCLLFDAPVTAASMSSSHLSTESTELLKRASLEGRVLIILFPISRQTHHMKIECMQTYYRSLGNFFHIIEKLMYSQDA